MIRPRAMLFSLILLGACLPARADIEIVCDEFASAQCDEMRRVVEATQRACAELFGGGAERGGAKIELDLQVQDYFNADERLNDGRFRTNWAFANARAMEAHVALQPPVPTELLEEAGLPLQTKIQIAHETTHLCMYRAFLNHDSHPQWLAEGLAVSVANRAVRATGDMGAREDEPWTCDEIHAIVALMKDKPGYGIESILGDESEEISSARLYAVRAGFIDWLDDIGALEAVVGEARRLGGGSGYATNLHDATLAAIRSAGVDDADRAFKDWINAFEPGWSQVYRSLQTQGKVWMQGAFDTRNAVCWSSQTLGEGNWTLSGSMKIFEGDKSQFNILLGKSEEGYVSVACATQWGVTVFRHLYKDNKWERIENKEVEELDLNEWVDFRVTKRRDRLMIRIAGQRPIMVDVTGIDLSGNWGLGCQNKSAGLWKDVRVER